MVVLALALAPVVGAAATTSCSSSAPPVAAPTTTATMTADDGESTDAAGRATASSQAPPVQTEPAVQGPNLVKNPGFEADLAAGRPPSAWAAPPPASGYEGPKSVFTGVFEGGHTGNFHATQYHPKSGQWTTGAEQDITGLAPGTYVAWIWTRGGGELQSASFEVSDTGAAPAQAPIEVTSDWLLTTISGIEVSSGKAHIRWAASGDNRAWLYVDDVHLHLAA